MRQDGRVKNGNSDLERMTEQHEQINELAEAVRIEN